MIKLLFHSYDWTLRYFRFKPFFNLFEAHNHPQSERTLTYCPDDNYNNGVELKEAAVLSILGTVHGQQQFTFSRSRITSWQVPYGVPHFRVLSSRTPCPREVPVRVLLTLLANLPSDFCGFP